jgi:hypothetical protein
MFFFVGLILFIFFRHNFPTVEFALDGDDATNAPSTSLGWSICGKNDFFQNFLGFLCIF